ncbi:MAG TPA: hypothetical protein VMV26_06580 [Alphaproteobacteria bacterium]|nr:hypothetical protein [Alphaproteobacteria bacterium]
MPDPKPVPYSVRNLGRDRLRQAFSLIQAVDPGLSLEAWRRYARPRVSGGGAPRRGILALEDQRGCILTLMEYHLETDLHDGRILRCTCLAGVDLLNPRAALRALVRAIRQRAEATGCEAIHVTAPRTLGALTTALVDSGFGIDAAEHRLALRDDSAEIRTDLLHA